MSEVEGKPKNCLECQLAAQEHAIGQLKQCGEVPTGQSMGGLGWDVFENADGREVTLAIESHSFEVAKCAHAIGAEAARLTNEGEHWNISVFGSGSRLENCPYDATKTIKMRAQKAIWEALQKLAS